MADEDEEERALEDQLQFQIKEHKDSLTAVVDALSADPSNPELLSVHIELVQAIKDAEEGIFHLKKARLLREADSILRGSDNLKAEPLDPRDVEAGPLMDDAYSVGSKCRFRHTDGRWYNGLIVELEGSGSAKISFLTPTSENMTMCKFFLQQRCRFGSNCRLSHGIDIPISSLKKYIPTTWEQSLVGSSILAVQDRTSGIWKEAELNSWDNELKIGEVVFCDNGASENLGSEDIMLSEYAQMSDQDHEYEYNSSNSNQTDSNSDSDEATRGFGFLNGTSIFQGGIQKETAIFAKWENHTRGIASKMMASMGYREGMGLGASGQGMVDPISVKILPSKQSLDDAFNNIDNKQHKDGIRMKKRTRGGKRLRDKKLGAAIKAAEEDEESKDVFSLINNQLSKHGKGSYVKKKQENASRKALVAHEDEISNLKIQIDKLEEMMKRNRKEKVVFEAANRKLDEIRKALADAEEARASTSSAVDRKDKEKKWLKF